MILDTSFLIDLFDGREGAFETGRTFAAESMIQRVPAPVVTELSYGASFGNEREQRNVHNALQMYPIVELDAPMALRAGQLLAGADRTADGDSGIDKVDPMVAAVADHFEEPVVTDNTDDFQRLGVTVEHY